MVGELLLRAVAQVAADGGGGGAWRLAEFCELLEGEGEGEGEIPRKLLGRNIRRLGAGAGAGAGAGRWSFGPGIFEISSDVWGAVWEDPLFLAAGTAAGTAAGAVWSRSEACHIAELSLTVGFVLREGGGELARLGCLAQLWPVAVLAAAWRDGGVFVGPEELFEAVAWAAAVGLGCGGWVTGGLGAEWIWLCCWGVVMVRAVPVLGLAELLSVPWSVEAGWVGPCAG